MGRRFYSVEEYRVALDLEIANSMRDPDGAVQRGAKEEIKRQAEIQVYDAYTPKFMSRRGENSIGGGSIVDEDSIVSFSTEKGFTLTMENLASWQQLYGGTTPNISLADAIQENGLWGAPPREFMGWAEMYYGYGLFGRNLVSDLELKGF